MKRILFVCLGNICRSPTAHGVFAKFVQDVNLTERIYIDSAGTGNWNVGKPPDMRTQKVALQRGYDLSALRARQIQLDDFENFDLILAMDKQNYRDLYSLAPTHHRHKVQLFLDYGESEIKEVPDPYYGESEGFIEVFDLVENAAKSLLDRVIKELKNQAAQ